MNSADGEPERANTPQPSAGLALSRHFVADRDVPCPSCGYNLRGCPDWKCPECGSPLPLAALRASHARSVQHPAKRDLGARMGLVLVSGTATTAAAIGETWWVMPLTGAVFATALLGATRLLIDPEAFARRSAESRRRSLLWTLGFSAGIAAGLGLWLIIEIRD